MRIQSRAIIVSSLFFLAADVHARLGEKRVGGRGYRSNNNDVDLDLVVVFEDDDGDAFTEMSNTFTALGEDVEVHSMLTRLNMATVRAKPKVRIRSSEDNLVDCLILIFFGLRGSSLLPGHHRNARRPSHQIFGRKLGIFSKHSHGKSSR